MSKTLFKRFLKIVDTFADKKALTDQKTGRTWTFRELQNSIPEGISPDISCPRGDSIELIFETLRSWRDGTPLCPFDGSAPDQEQFTGLPESICHLKITSGTTSAPRIIAFSGAQLAADAAKIVSTMELRPDWANLGVISMAHSYGFSNLVLPLLLHGIPLVWLGDPLPENLRKALSTSDSWTLAAVPAMWNIWSRAGVLNSSIKLAISAGAPLSIDLESLVLKQFGVRIRNFYGSTECGGIAFDQTDRPRSESSFAGHKMDQTDGFIGADGCLKVSSPSVAEGIWESGEIRPFNGIFETSDLARIEDKSVFLLGRADDLINVAGKKVSPAKIESILHKCPEIDQCVVFGIDSEARAQEIVAGFSLNSGAEIESVRKSVIPQLETHERPRIWWNCSELKPDRRGKISRKQWRDKFLAERSDRV